MLFRRIYTKIANIFFVATTRNPILMGEVNRERNYIEIKNYFKKHPEGAATYKNELEYLESNYPYLMQCRYNTGLEEKIREELATISYDKQKREYYIIYKNKKVYFPTEMELTDVINYYKQVRFEQSEDSPHKYLSESICISPGDIVLDIGTAEGLFAVDALCLGAKKVICFESEGSWTRALNDTFENDDRVEIVEKFVSNTKDVRSVCIDEYLPELKDESVYVKMDIEGEEINACNGGKGLFLSSKELKFAICTYHKEEDASQLYDFFTDLDYDCGWSDGYMLLLTEALSPPYFRHGVIRGHKGK